MKKGMDLGKKLYWSLGKFSLRYNYFAFFDVKEYYADQLFIQNKVRVWFDGEYEKRGSQYIVVLCHVRKRDTDKFLSSMESLNRKMQICGHSDYESTVEHIMSQIEKGRKLICKRK